MLVIAHRGASGYAPENTLKSFQLAIDMGADGIELDVRACASGEIVVFHDDHLERLTGAGGRVADTPLAALRKLKVNGSEPIPTLEEVLRFIDRRASLHIEVKTEDAAPATAAMLDALAHRGWGHESFSVISFYHAPLADIRARHPSLQTGAIIVGAPAQLASFGSDCGATSVNPCLEFLTPAFMEDARARSLEVHTWTVNDATSLARARALGVNAVVGDFPDRLRG